MGKVIYYVPPDRVILDAIKKVCPEHYEKALNKYLEKLNELP